MVSCNFLFILCVLILYFVGDRSLDKFDDAPLELEGKKLC